MEWGNGRLIILKWIFTIAMHIRPQKILLKNEWRKE